MARTAGMMSEANDMRWPPPGWSDCTCVLAEKWKSPKKGTGAVMLTWTTTDGEYLFEDPIFVTTKAISRLVLVAKRVCAIPDDMAIPDDDVQAASTLARFILDHAQGKQARVLVEVHDEEYMVAEGPEQGQKKTKKRSKVAFAGYDRVKVDLQDAGNAEPLPAGTSQGSRPQPPPTEWRGEPGEPPPKVEYESPSPSDDGIPF
ncbi:MAG: hypothetical protein IMZ71_03540 [Chloroflexi bacterium]|nr:hypothetical protein [Chloroflexota bacterium]